jgi:tetratricopeptide (TPR) repeat protein
MIISTEVLQTVKSLHEKGLYLQAFHAAQQICQLPKWEGTEAKLLAAHLAYHLGAPKTSYKWTVQVWRKDRTHAEACFYYASEIAGTKGHLPALIFLRRYQDVFESANDKIKAWWQSLQAQLYAHLRDFETAEEWLKKAEETKPDEPWLYVARSFVLELQDRYEEALAAAKKALKLKAWHRSGVKAVIHLLVLFERYDEALELLKEADKNLESAWIATKLADLQTELGMFEEARNSLERIIELTPMREEFVEQWLYGKLSDAAYHCGDLKQAKMYADIASTKFHEKIRDNLSELKGDEKRVLLPLGFVRQHHVTCAPATLSNISRYWEKQAEHLQLAEEICYNGTTAHSERNWAEKNGYVAREFTINWEDAVSLLNRKVPFTLATVQPGNGHLQAVIGYDERRKTLLIRDPYFKKIEEFLAEELFESQKATGPRGMALVPFEQADLLLDLELNENQLNDYLFLIQDALNKHKREQAAEMLSKMQAEFPHHQLTWRAKWAIAGYDANALQVAECIEELHKLFPEDINLKMSKLSSVREQVRQDEQIGWLTEWSKDKKTHPLLWQRLGYELSRDARQHTRAMRWLYKSMLCLPDSGLGYHLMADILWAQRRFEDALELYRMAACLDDKDEQMAMSYFMASRHLKQTEKALRFLEDRFRRFGSRSNLPGQTLFHALRELGRTVEAFHVLEDSLHRRPDDGTLKLFVAEAQMRYGNLERAESLLAEAEKESPHGEWLRTNAMLAYFRGELKKALEIWREIVTLEPLALDAHDNIAQYLAETESKPAAQEYLREVTEKFPYHRELHKLRLGWLQEEPTEAEKVVRHLLELDRNDSWGHRELSRLLARRKAFEEALKETKIALQLEPNEPFNQWAHGIVLAQMNRLNAASFFYQKALQLSVDADYALASWLEICRTKEEKMSALRFLRRELSNQVTFGAGLLAYREQACRIFKPEELLTDLRELLREREDSWTAWSIVVSQLIDMRQFDEALEIANKATERFPLVSQIWFDLSQVHKNLGHNEAEIDALKRALQINSTWSFAIQQLVEVYQRLGRLEEARQVLKEAIGRAPLDHFLHGYLADLQWQAGEKERALETAKHAISLNPNYDWGWRAVQLWSRELNKPDEVLELARNLVVRRPDEVHSWLNLARLLDKTEQTDECLEALDKALAHDACNVPVLCLKARALADANRYEDAFIICQTKLPDGHLPDELRFVAADLEGQRGNCQTALQMMEKLGEESPDYYPVWEKLASVYRGIDEHNEDYLRVVQELVRLAPQNPTTYGFLGEAYVCNDDYPNAKTALKQAITLAPAYDFAAWMLFDINARENKRDECEQVLEHLHKYLPEEAGTHARSIVFHARSHNQEEVKKAWRKLCLTANAERKHFDRAINEMHEASLTKQPFFWSVIDFARKEKDVTPVVGAVWFECAANLGKIKYVAKELESTPEKGLVWMDAADAYMQYLIDEKKKTMLRKFIQQHEAALKSDDAMWAAAGRAINILKDYKWSCEWFSDWKKRKNLRPWMLWNYALPLRRTGQTALAEAVHRHALTLPPDDTVNYHQTMLGLDQAIAGNFRHAHNYSAQINKEALADWVAYFYQLLQMLLDVQMTSQVKSGEYDRLVKRMLNHGLSTPNLFNDKLMSESLRQSLDRALSLKPNGFQKFWIYFRLWLAYLGSLMDKKIT